MAGPRKKRCSTRDIEVEKRRLRVEQLLLRGLTNRLAMSAALGVDQPTLVKDVKHIHEQWLKTRSTDAIARAELRTRQIEGVAILALESYERSRKDDIELTTVEKQCDYTGCLNGIIISDDERDECPRCRGEGRITVETRKVRGQAGDPAFLNVAKACFQECARIEGLYPDIKASMLQRTVQQQLGPDGVITQKVEDLYIEAPYEDVIKARAMLENLKIKCKVQDGNDDPPPNVIVV